MHAHGAARIHHAEHRRSNGFASAFGQPRLHPARVHERHIRGNRREPAVLAAELELLGPQRANAQRFGSRAASGSRAAARRPAARSAARVGSARRRSSCRRKPARRAASRRVAAEAVQASARKRSSVGSNVAVREDDHLDLVLRRQLRARPAAEPGPAPATRGGGQRARPATMRQIDLMARSIACPQRQAAAAAASSAPKRRSSFSSAAMRLSAFSSVHENRSL